MPSTRPTARGVSRTRRACPATSALQQFVVFFSDGMPTALQRQVPVRRPGLRRRRLRRRFIRATANCLDVGLHLHELSPICRPAPDGEQELYPGVQPPLRRATAKTRRRAPACPGRPRRSGTSSRPLPRSRLLLAEHCGIPHAATLGCPTSARRHGRWPWIMRRT